MNAPRNDAMTPAFLRWSIKDSLVRYVLGMPDGSAEISPPARISAQGFRFPAAAPAASAEGFRFSGGVTLTGHGGLLKLVFDDPWLTRSSQRHRGWELTIRDPYEPETRLAFATVDDLSELATGGIAATGTRLTADGADLFFSGPYTEGTDLDDPVIETTRADAA